MKNNNNSAAQEESRRQQQAEAPDSTDRLRVGITHGDFNGVGYEVILKMLDDARILELCTPIIYGSAKIAAFYRKSLELAGPWQPVQINSAADASADAVNIINVIGQEAHITPGEASKEAGEAAFIALERAVEDLKNGHIDVLLTAPINKSTIQSDTFRFPGHTEYLAASAAGLFNRMLALRVENALHLNGFVNTVNGYQALATVIASAAMFLLFQNIRIRSDYWRRWVFRLAPLSFGVYLLHDSDFTRALLWRLVDLPRFGGALLPSLAYLTGAVLLIAVAGYAVDAVYQRLYRLLRLPALETKLDALTACILQRIVGSEKA